VFGDSVESSPPFFLCDFPLADFNIKKARMKKNHRYANIDIVAGKKGFFSQAVINLLQNREKTVWKHGHVAFVSIGEDVPHYLLPSSYTPILVSLGN